MNKKESFLNIADEVMEAKENKKPIVALESTIISHGMPYPENIAMASKVESIIRENGAVPATIALIEGKIKIGINKDELEYMASSKDILKASRRDIPVVVARRLSAATTVAGTMICASLAGIKVFATGGIGGVHRGAEKTFDISADLQELSKTDVAVVSAGAKSILDLKLTMEYLETMGVPVIGYGTNEFPAFYTRQSGIFVNYKLDTPEDVAAVILAQINLGYKGGMVIANPIPEEYSMDKDLIDSVIKDAIGEAEREKITGKDLTPFLLTKIKDITEGKSLDANLKLVYNNAELAAKIAVSLSRLT
ncbi:MAG: pseudouridine-5'-phosphate glycosidase [Spirochaetales bacterium]|nr:pseudouridine-5'-phosphate glycosidase [Spirochaetales bacterium]